MTKNFGTPETAINWIVERIDRVLKTVNEFGELVDFENFKSREFNEWRDAQRHCEGWVMICEQVCLDTLRDYGVIEVKNEKVEKKLVKPRYYNENSYRLNNGKILDYSQFHCLVRALGEDEVQNLFEPVEVDGREIDIKVYTYGFNHNRIALLREMRAMLAQWSTFEY